MSFLEGSEFLEIICAHKSDYFSIFTHFVLTCTVSVNVLYLGNGMTVFYCSNKVFDFMKEII